MSPAGDRALLDALAAVEAALSDLGAPYMIIGGIAVIARGAPRFTDDIDATVWAAGLDLSRLLSAMAQQSVVPRIDDVEELARESQVVLLRHAPSETPVDLSPDLIGASDGASGAVRSGLRRSRRGPGPGCQAAEEAEAQRVSRRAAEPQRACSGGYSGSPSTSRVIPSLSRAAPKLSSSPIRLSASRM